MILTRTPEEAAAAWDRERSIRASYGSRAEFLAYCASVQAWCAATGRNEFGLSATVREVTP